MNRWAGPRDPWWDGRRGWLATEPSLLPWHRRLAARWRRTAAWFVYRLASIRRGLGRLGEWLRCHPGVIVTSIIAVVIVGVVLIARGQAPSASEAPGSPGSNENLAKGDAGQVSVSVQMPTELAVGESETIYIRFTNHSQQAAPLRFQIAYDDSWLDRNVLLPDSGCKLDHSLRMLDCGTLAPGQSKTFTLSATPYAPGNFRYGIRMDGNPPVAGIEQTVLPRGVDYPATAGGPANARSAAPAAGTT